MYSLLGIVPDGFDKLVLDAFDRLRHRYRLMRIRPVAELVEATFFLLRFFMKGYMYILLCADASYYTGSTVDLELRIAQHQAGEAANHTRRRLPVKLVYFEEFDRIDEAFYREKQVQGWSRKKKEALIRSRSQELPILSRNHTQFPRET